MNYLSIDVGTTGCKCQLFSHEGEILEYLFEEYEIKTLDGERYVDVDAIWACLQNMIRTVSKTREVNSVCISSFGEAFVLLDEKDEILFYPMLYTDPRGEAEAMEIRSVIGEEKAFSITGVLPHSMYSLSKLLYIKNNYPALFARGKKVMLLCDYIGYLLTGKRVIDYSLASRTGAFDIQNMCFCQEILDKWNIPVETFSTPMRAGSIVGKIKEEILPNATLVLGSHDQICSALGAGVIQAGDAVDGMGTVECITCVFQGKVNDLQMGLQGYPCVPYAVEGLYCTYVLNYSCGSTVNWLRKNIMHKYSGTEDNFFSYIEKGMEQGPTGILVLPYFDGAATPFQDSSARGAILNLSTTTSDSALYKSIMEGMAFEMKLNLEEAGRYGINTKNLVMTGGGANSETWLQIKADIQNTTMKVLRSSEGGLCGCAILQALAMGQVTTLEEAKAIFVRYTKEFSPNEENGRKYQPYYEKYKKLYKTLKEFI